MQPLLYHYFSSESRAPFSAPQKGNIFVVEKKLTHPVDASHLLDMDDLCDMNHLHEAPLTHCLKRRFAQDKIYTMTGDVLIALNPYKLIPGLYDNSLIYLDIPGTKDDNDDEETLSNSSSPHVFKIANAALVNIFKGPLSFLEVDGKTKNQSIIVSGESGAGKTEASKRVMGFLIDADREISVSKAQDERSTNLNALKNMGDYIRKVLILPLIIKHLSCF